MRSITLRWLMVLLTCSGVARAEDIDLFIGAPATSNDLPNVLFIVDNTANWNQAFTNEKAALANTFRSLPVDKFNIGIMLATETGSPNNNIKGGYVRAAVRRMNAGNREKYAQLIESLDQLGDKGNGGYSALTMAEAFYYFTGATPYAGNNKIKTDYANNIHGTNASRAVYALPGNALDTIDATRYRGFDTSSCAKNYIIYISNGPNQQNSSTDSLANTKLAAAGGSTTQIALSPSGSQSNPSDEWARFMRDQHAIITYTIDVDPPASGQGPGWTALLKSMAGDPARYQLVNSATGGGAQISDAVNRALSEIQAVNSVFASVSLPLSVNTQGTYLNQVYVGMFRPDADALPRWYGNLKQYRLGYVDGDLRLQDAGGEHAINALTGFVTECARSYWTPQAADTYWSFRPQGSCIPPAGATADLYKVSNFPDGNIVEKGAQGYMLRSMTSRSMKTCSPSFAGCTTLTDFNTANSAITSSLLGAASSTERDQLIQWARGLDIADENGDANTSQIRPSAHGDVVHSRPVAINFGSDANPKVAVFYGGNDGVFRAVNGNRTASIGDVPAGGELWSFMPPEFYGQIKRIRENQTLIDFPTVNSASALPKPYGVDGAITAYADGSNAWIYATMRRGGRALYAFDVDPADPTDITLKWKKGCPTNLSRGSASSDVGCTAGMAALGQTWSQPKVVRSAGYSSPLLIMGGGYDPCEDAEPNTCTASSKGARVFVLNADTGEIVATFTTDRGVVADAAIIADQSSGYAQYAYIADLGGNLYRIDIGAAAPASWSMQKIASLGCSDAGACQHNRKFMFAPDIVFEDGAYVLLLGSGDREKPRNYANTVDNYFFAVRDKPLDASWLASEASNCGSAVLCLDSLTPILSEANPSADALSEKKGWYLGLEPREQVVTSAITIFGTVTFSTHEPRQPESGVCSADLGVARVYNVAFKNGAPEDGADSRSEELPGTIGLPPSPVAGMVTLDDGRVVPFCIGCRPESPLEGEQPKVPPSSAPTQPKSRVYWYIQR